MENALENQTNQKEQEAAQAIYNHAANMIINENKSGDEVRKLLIEKGMDEATAASLVYSIEDKISEAKRQRASKDMLYGALWCIGGIIVTALTYSAASGGGRYVVAWGAIIFGAIQFFRGVINSNS